MVFDVTVLAEIAGAALRAVLAGCTVENNYTIISNYVHHVCVCVSTDYQSITN